MQLTGMPTFVSGGKPVSPVEKFWGECALARRLITAGAYSQAHAVIADYWNGKETTMPTDVDGIEENGEIQLLGGLLSSHLDKGKEAKASARDFISAAIEKFKEAGKREKAIQATLELAGCYRREGAFEEGRIILQDALADISPTETILRAHALVALGYLERVAGRKYESLLLHRGVAALVEPIDDHALKATFHIEYANTLLLLAESEGKAEFFDQAFIEYTASSVHCEHIGHLPRLGRIENNLGYLSLRLGQHEEAHRYLKKAHKRFTLLKQKTDVAQVEDTQARVYLAQRRFSEALALSRNSVSNLEDSGLYSYLAESLITQGVILAKQGKDESAEAALMKAAHQAAFIGDSFKVGLAHLVMAEELAEYMGLEKTYKVYSEADRLLSNPQDTAISNRLHECANRLAGEAIMRKTASEREDEKTHPQSWDTFSLERATKEFQEGYIKRALKEARGLISHAAHLLGISHQNLDKKLKSKEFSHLRDFQSNRRKKSIVKDNANPTVRKFPAPTKMVEPTFDQELHVSMADDAFLDLGIAEGCYVIASPCEVSEGDFIVLQTINGAFAVGFYHKEESGVLLMVGNDEYESLYFCDEQVRGIEGKVTHYYWPDKPAQRIQISHLR